MKKFLALKNSSTFAASFAEEASKAEKASTVDKSLADKSAGRRFSGGGFTLIELLIVIAVAGVLATIVLLAVNPGKQLARARDASRKQNLAALSKALGEYYTVNGAYPDPGIDLISDSSEGSSWIPGLIPDYLKLLPKDPKQAGLPVFLAPINLFNPPKVFADTATMSWTLGTATKWSLTTALINGSSGVPIYDSSSARAGTGPSRSWSHTGSSSSNRILVVGVTIAHGGSNVTVSSVTYAGQPLTKIIGACTLYSGAGPCPGASTLRSELWYIISPATGANSIIATFSENTDYEVGATSWTNVDQTTPIANSGSSTGNGASPNTNITTTNSTQMIVDNLASANSSVATFGPGQTQRWNVATGNDRGAGSSKPGPFTPTPTSTPTPTPTPTPIPTPSPSPVPLAFKYLYTVTSDFQSFTLWAGLEDSDDPEIYNKPGAKCSRIPPSSDYNYCVGF